MKRRKRRLKGNTVVIQKYTVVADAEEKEGLLKVKDGGNRSCWKFTSRSERLGEDPVQHNREEVEKGERGGKKTNPDPPGISEQKLINKRIMMCPVLLWQKNFAQEPSFQLFKNILRKLRAENTTAFWSLSSGSRVWENNCAL